MKLIRHCGAMAALVVLLASPAWGQRVEFPTPLAQAGPAAAPSLPSAPATPGWDPYAAQGLPAPGTTFSSPSTAPYTLPPTNAAPPGYPAAGPYAAPPTYPPGAYAPPGSALDPYAIAPPPPAQPYYTPNPAAPGYLYPEAPSPYGSPAWANPLDTVNGWNRFRQEIRLDETFMPDSGNEKVEFNDIETSATFALPPGWNPSPLYITPGFGLQLWDGPPSHGPGSADLPPQTYCAYLDVAWNPHPTPIFGAELGVRVGVYSDFDTFDSNSIRVMGRGLAVLNYTPTSQFKLGVIYLDRNKIKMLPAGGWFWTPNPDTRLEAFFPRPKYEHRFTTTGRYQWWWYFVGEYGGGAWTIQRADGGTDDFDYNDIRVSLGIEWVPETTASALRGYFEIGYAFDRQLVYRYQPPLTQDLNEAIFVRGGLSF